MSIEHSLITAANGHGILSSLGPYASAAARRAAVVTAADVSAGKVCLQTDTGEIYYLASQAAGVPTWIKINTTADATAFSGDFAALAATYSLTVRGFWRGDLGVTGTQGTGKAAWANQSGTATAMSSGLTDGIGSVGTGLNGKASTITNGSTQNCTYTMPAQGTPSTLPTHKWGIARFLGTAVSRQFLGENSGAGVALSGSADAAPNINFSQYDGSSGAVTTGVQRNQWYQWSASFMGDATSQIRFGAHAPAAANCGNAAPVVLRCYASGAANNNPMEVETLALMELEGTLANFLLFRADAGPKAQTFWTSAIEI